MKLQELEEKLLEAIGAMSLMDFLTLANQVLGTEHTLYELEEEKE